MMKMINLKINLYLIILIIFIFLFSFYLTIKLFLNANPLLMNLEINYLQLVFFLQLPSLFHNQLAIIFVVLI
jgi:hypothetical protein